MFLLVIVGPVYCIFQLQMEFAQENVFCTEIYSDTQLMQKYRDISLNGGFLPHATLFFVTIILKGLSEFHIHDDLYINRAYYWY